MQTWHLLSQVALSSHWHDAAFMLLAVAHPAAVVSSLPSIQAPTMRWCWPPKQLRCHATPLAWLLWSPVWSQVLSRYGAFVKPAPPRSSGHLNQPPSAEELIRCGWPVFFSPKLAFGVMAVLLDGRGEG